MPGFIDMHVHLREPGREDKETVLTGTQAAIHGGFTSIACIPNTTPVADNETVIEAVLYKAMKANLADVYPIACITKGQKGEELTEMLLLNRAGAIAFSDDAHFYNKLLLEEYENMIERSKVRIQKQELFFH